MSSLKQLKDASSLSDVAVLLGYKPKSLSFLLYKMPDETKYRQFRIPKKSGGFREIMAPVERIKSLQRRFANLLYDCRAEIEEQDNLRSLSHGFRKSHSIVTNARSHTGRRYVLNLDLEEFFPSINFGRVRGFFLKNRNFELNERVATIAAQIACHNNILPQGSPCSPVISDLIGHLLDVRLAQLAKRHQCTYSRYADDITISTNRKTFPAPIASQTNPAASGWASHSVLANILKHIIPWPISPPDDGESSSWVLGDDLVAIISKCGFSVNHKKTRMQYKTNRQTVTGLTVNKSVNIRSDYYRYARAMCHSLFTTGEYYRPSTSGIIVDLDSDESTDDKKISKIEPIEGIINHIHYVKDCKDQRDIKNKTDHPTAIRNLYRRLLFYKNFISLDLPLIVCEGKTDSIYLKCAIKNLTKFQPKLGFSNAESFDYNLRFFGYNKLSNEILRIQGGTGDLGFLLLKYRNVRKIYKHKPMKRPVIILIDNDDGAKSIFKIIKNNYKIDINLNTDDLFYHITQNLYLVKAPSKGANGESYIESFFDDSILQTKINGKKFNAGNSINENSEYGKIAFAENVVRPQSKNIDFSGFEQILDRIVAVIDSYNP